MFIVLRGHVDVVILVPSLFIGFIIKKAYQILKIKNSYLKNKHSYCYLNINILQQKLTDK